MGDCGRYADTRRRVRVLTAAAAVALAVGLPACGGGRPEPPPGGGQPEPPPAAPVVVRLGAVVPLSGYSAPTGRRMVEAFQMAVDEANAAGGVLGRRVELVIRDDACEPGTAVSAATDLVDQGITVSVGGACSQATVSVLRTFHKAGVPMIIPVSNSTDLLQPGYDGVFLLTGTTKAEGERAATLMAKLGTRRLALIDDGTSFADNLAAATAANLSQPTTKITLAARLTLSQGAESYPRIVEAVLRQRVDMVFFTAYYADAAALIRDLRAAGYRGRILLSDGGVDPALFGLISPAQAEGVYGLTSPLPQFEPRAKGWAAKYRATYGREPSRSALLAYDAVRLALNAIGRAGSLDYAAVRKAIATTARGDVELLSGPPEFNRDGTRTSPTFVLLQVRRGAFALVRQAGK